MRPVRIGLMIVAAAATLAFAALWLRREEPLRAIEVDSTDPMVSTPAPEPAPAPGAAKAVRADDAASEVAPAAEETRVAKEPGTSCLLGGRVFFDDGRTPAAHAIVGLFAPALVDDSAACTYALKLHTGGEFANVRTVLQWTSTDGDGGFRFDDLDPGAYVVRTEMGPLLATATDVLVLVKGETRAGLVLKLPPHGWLAGRILAPPEASFEGVLIELHRADPPSIPRYWSNGAFDDALDEGVEGDGSYRIGPVEPGLHDVWLSFRAMLGPNTSRMANGSPGVYLGQIQIDAGPDTVRDFDLRDGFPGGLKVELRFPHALQTEHPQMSKEPFVVAVPTFERLGVIPLRVRTRSGVANLAPLAPGSWRLIVYAPQMSWEYEHDSTAFVSAGQTTEIALEIPLVEAKVRCVDARTNEPLAGHSLMVTWTHGDSQSGRSSPSDQEGFLRLDLTPGRYAVAVGSWTATDEYVEGTPSDVEWTVDGPRPAVLKLDVPR